MNDKVKRELLKINTNAARGKELITEVDVFEKDREAWERTAQKASPKERKKMRAYLDNPRFYKKEKQINEDVASEIERKVEYQIKKAIRTGKIPPPKEDAWMKKIKKKFQ